MDKNFKIKLANTIEEIEKNSEVEIVVAIKPFSAFYYELYAISGFITFFITFTFFIFTEHLIGDYLLYMGTIFSFIFGISLGFLFKNQLKIFISKKILKRNVEIMARALFQKGGIYHTKQKVGILILFSMFEKTHFIVADRKAQNAIPYQEWEKINNTFDKIIKKPSFYEDLISELLTFKDIFTSFLPPVENDINELPDDLEIEL
ncbi:MAG: hypothetical protein U0457_02545 [Candidatus Sericytochromatia bacterium]